MSILLDNSLASSTISVYKRAWILFNEAFKEISGGLKYSLPLHFSHILMFISYLNLLRFASSSITTYITAISYIHKFGDFKDPTTHFSVQKTLSAVNRLTGKLDSRLPITIFILARLSDAIEKTVSNRYHRVLLRAMFTSAFFGLFRIGEITTEGHNVVCLDMSQCNLLEDKVIIKIVHFKHNVSQDPVILSFSKQSDKLICPVTAMGKYFEFRGLDSGPLFCFLNKKPVTRKFFSQKLKNCLNFCGFDLKAYKCHSFRIGGASYLSSLGYSDSQLRKLGRWNSNAFLYISEIKFL